MGQYWDGADIDQQATIFNPLLLSGSKEEDRRIVIMEEATRKRIKVNFILTGHCSDNQLEEQAVYYEIADATSGFVSVIISTALIKVLFHIQLRVESIIPR